MANATLTLAVSTALKKKMNEIKGVNWSEETRQFLEERIEKLNLLKKFDSLTKNSKLTEKDILEISTKINQGIAKKHSLTN